MSDKIRMLNKSPEPKTTKMASVGQEERLKNIMDPGNLLRALFCSP